MTDIKYKRVLMKLSGEALAGDKGQGIDLAVVSEIAQDLKEVHDLGTQIAIVVGGGNLWRGEPASKVG
ncbi:amino acid kinase family protein, partial [Leuconostoc lactis]